MELIVLPTISVIRRKDDPLDNILKQALLEMFDICTGLVGPENKFPDETLGNRC